MVLLIDNYDSFSYNLFDYIKQLGHDCLVIRNDEKSVSEIKEIKNIDFIVLSPGPGIPKNAGITFKIIEEFHQTIPILGICLGHQALGEFFGAKLIKAEKPMHGKTSKLHFEEHALFKNIDKPFDVMRYHSLILEDVKEPLQVIAKTKDDEIMAFAHHDLPIVGIQFHPESILTENGLLLIDNFFKISK